MSHKPATIAMLFVTHLMLAAAMPAAASDESEWRVVRRQIAFVIVSDSRHEDAEKRWTSAINKLTSLVRLAAPPGVPTTLSPEEFSMRYSDYASARFHQVWVLISLSTNPNVSPEKGKEHTDKTKKITTALCALVEQRKRGAGPVKPTVIRIEGSDPAVLTETVMPAGAPTAATKVFSKFVGASRLAECDPCAVIVCGTEEMLKGISNASLVEAEATGNTNENHWRLEWESTGEEESPPPPIMRNPGTVKVLGSDALPGVGTAREDDLKLTNEILYRPAAQAAWGEPVRNGDGGTSEKPDWKPTIEVFTIKDNTFRYGVLLEPELNGN